MNKHVLTVTGAEAGLSLAGLLAGRLGWDAVEAAARVNGGGVYLGGRRVCDPGVEVEPGQKVVAYASPDRAAAEEPELAYVDRFVAVLIKPAGLPSVATRRGGTDTVEAFVARRFSTGARLMHRLDREVSGLMLVSRRGGPSRAALARDLAAHRVERRYLARVQGSPKRDAWTMDRRITVDRGRPRLSDDPRAKPAVTHARVLRREGPTSLLRLRLETGRTHQLRLHLSGEGLPMVGDTRHGGPPARRLALHAHHLRLVHPKTGESLDLHVPWPADMP